MSPVVSIVFPHQLFQQHPALQKGRPVFLIEEWLFFKQYNFHQQKIVLHRASMKQYEQLLTKQKHDVHYIDSLQPQNDCRELVKWLTKKGVKEIHACDPVDNWLLSRLRQSCTQSGVQLVLYPSPNFINTLPEVTDYFNKRKTYFQTDFYTWQRKQRAVLMDQSGHPMGGKWTFDTENRKKYPAKQPVPELKDPPSNTFIREAIEYTQLHFSSNYGDANGKRLFVIDHKEAEKWLEDFLTHRFEHFGIYEDAMVAKESVLHHSVLTPMLNIGLLSPGDILNKSIEYARSHDIPMNSLEGFVRQIMGWREFIRIVYEREGSFQRTRNYWGFTRKIPASFWNGTTGIAPIDITIKKIIQTGYCHHIERLMVLGNFMLLCEFDPDEVYRWFMELFIDAYDWVMVPNVYGMTQFADGGLMTTKPYISGSNYLMKMSDFPKGDWQAVWDGLFWRFMQVHRSFFAQNPRLGMLLNTLDKIDTDKRKAHFRQADLFLKKLDS